MDEVFEHHLIESARLWRAAVNRLLGRDALTLSAWRVLSLLYRDGEGDTQKVLAQRLGVEGPTLVKLLDSLVRNGWIERRASRLDRRANTIWLTEGASTRIRRIETDLNQLREAMVDRLDVEARRSLAQSLARLHVQLQAYREDGAPPASETDAGGHFGLATNQALPTAPPAR
ncbi:MAG: MarR family winged helix-turn-helix transcriptional regulator [Halothiobacillaceae bacterium]